MFDDKASIGTVECPNGHPVKIKLGVARRSRTISCPQCDAMIHLDGSQLSHELRKVNREWDKLQQTLKRLGR